MVGPQPVDAPGINGPAEVIVDLFLRVPLFLVSTGSDAQPESQLK